MTVFWKRAFARVPNCPRVFFFFLEKSKCPSARVPKAVFWKRAFARVPECPTAQGCFSFFGKEQVPQCPGRPSARSLNPSPIISHYSLKKIKSVFLSKFSYRCLYFQPQLVFQGGLPNPIQFSLGNLFLSRYDGISSTHESSPIDWKLKRGLE